MKVIHLSFPEPSIAIVTLEDRENKNTFSPKLIQELLNTFEIIKNNTDLKIVIIHGYENYFFCGGTKEELLAMQQGKLTFTELNFYRLLLDCEIPTIAAMQGHTIGGGLAFSCYADIMILAEESFYSANFMKYGFTPGMGATFTIPQKFGTVLGHEMLLTANHYHGGTLKNRGIAIEVVRRKEVLNLAINIAKDLTSKTRVSLINLKKHLNEKIILELPRIIEQELKMHQITFRQPEVKERIESLF